MTALSFKRKVNFHVVVKFAQGRAFFLEFGRSGLEMNNNNYIDKQLYLGIDGGGSKCRAVIYCDDEGVIADAISGPANVLRGAEKAQQHIIEATDIALAQIGLDADYKTQLIAGIGLAGLNLESCMNEMKQWNAPFKQVFYTTDLHIACVGAHGGEDGAVMIIGTGSSALVSEQQQLIEMGGHGFPVGDAGSGAWLGFKSIELTLKVMEGLHSATEFTQAIVSHYGVDKAIELAQIVSRFTPTEFAKLAPLIVQHAQAGDRHALSIVEAGAEYLSQLASKLLEGRDVQLSLIGGLSPLIEKYLTADVASRLTPAQQPPEIGAVLFAKIKASS